MSCFTNSTAGKLRQLYSELHDAMKRSSGGKKSSDEPQTGGEKGFEFVRGAKLDGAGHEAVVATTKPSGGLAAPARDQATIHVMEDRHDSAIAVVDLTGNGSGIWRPAAIQDQVVRAFARRTPEADNWSLLSGDSELLDEPMLGRFATHAPAKPSEAAPMDETAKFAIPAVDFEAWWKTPSSSTLASTSSSPETLATPASSVGDSEEAGRPVVVSEGGEKKRYRQTRFCEVGLVDGPVRTQ